MKVIPPQSGLEFLLEFDTPEEYEQFFERADQVGYFLLDAGSFPKGCVFRAISSGSPRTRKIRPLQISRELKGTFRIETCKVEPPATLPGPAPKESATDSLRDRLRALSVNEKAMLALKADLMERRALMQENNLKINEFLLRNPRMTEQEIAWLGRNPSVPMPTLLAILTHQNWMKQSVIRTAVLMNPRTPAPTVLELIPSASPTDLLKLHHSSELRGDVRVAVTKELRKRHINPKRSVE